MCTNCGYGFLDELNQPKRTYHACPRCGNKLNPPVTVGRTEESTDDAKPYQSLVEHER